MQRPEKVDVEKIISKFMPKMDLVFEVIDTNTMSHLYFSKYNGESVRVCTFKGIVKNKTNDEIQFSFTTTWQLHGGRVSNLGFEVYYPISKGALAYFGMDEEIGQYFIMKTKQKAVEFFERYP